MRFDKSVTFYYKGTDGRYNPNTSKSGGWYELIQAVIKANVTEVGTERAAQVFGSFTQRSLVVRLIVAPPLGWSYLTIAGMPGKYVLQTAREPLKGHTLIVERDDTHGSILQA